MKRDNRLPITPYTPPKDTILQRFLDILTFSFKEPESSCAGMLLYIILAFGIVLAICYLCGYTFGFSSGIDI